MKISLMYINLKNFPERSTMPFGLFGKYISDSEDSIDSNYPSWPCLYKKKDRSICGKRYFCKDGCVKHYRFPPEKNVCILL